MTTRRRKAAESGKRGMALLIVVTSLAVLTALAVEFAYDTHVDARLAANARDELRATYLAKSAMNFSRLLLHFQYQLDQQATNIQQGLQAVGGAQGGDAAAMAGMPGMGMMGMGSIRLWDLVPMESDAINAFVGAISGSGDSDGDIPLAPSDPLPGELIPATGLRSFGSFQGGFSAEIQDEESKVNVNKLNNPGARGGIAAQQLMLLWGDPMWDFLFSEENSHGERMTREDLLIRIRDWIDEDEVETALNLASPMEVFAQGFGDEERSYLRYPQRYSPKNGLFDSLEELFLVAGFSDRHMAAFGDRLTVYPDINARLNINTTDPLQQMMNIQAAAAEPSQQELHNPFVIETILEQIQLMQTFGSFMGMTVQQFVGILEANGIVVRPEIKHNPAANDYLGDKSQTFLIRATGQAGDVQKTLTTVVRYGRDLGRVLYYRED